MAEAKITALQQAYNLLPKTYCGITRKTMPQGEHRVGVCRTSDFYQRLLGILGVPKTDTGMVANRRSSACCCNEWCSFKDSNQAFSKIRNQLQQGYPEAVTQAAEVQLRKLHGWHSVDNIMFHGFCSGMTH